MIEQRNSLVSTKPLLTLSKQSDIALVGNIALRHHFVSESSCLFECVKYDAKLNEDMFLAQANALVQVLASSLLADFDKQIRDYVPSYTSLLVRFEQGAYLDYYRLEKMLGLSLDRFLKRAINDEGLSARLTLKQDTANTHSSLLEIPVCYEPSSIEELKRRGMIDSPVSDLAEVAKKCSLSVEELIHTHSQQDYNVFAVGFLPNFAYMGQTPDSLYIPRRANPRKRVPAGAVAIADNQCAVYPQDSPGGWQVLGYTPLDLKNEGLSFRTGDTVRFKPVEIEAFISLYEASRAEQNSKQTQVYFAPPELKTKQASDKVTLLKIQNVGFYAQFVDAGRRRCAHKGYSESGALDTCAYLIGHALLQGMQDAQSEHTSNTYQMAAEGEQQSASIEVSLGDFAFRVSKPTVIVITGAFACCSFQDESGQHKAFNRYEPVLVPAGGTVSITKIGQCGFGKEQALKVHKNDRASAIPEPWNSVLSRGTRCYITFAGKIEAPELFSSLANVSREGSGGLRGDGSGLKSGDAFAVHPFIASANTYKDKFDNLNNREGDSGVEKLLAKIYAASSDKALLNEYQWTYSLPLLKQDNASMVTHGPQAKHANTEELTLYFTPAYQWRSFALSQQLTMLESIFELTSDLSRMGMRLKGPAISVETSKQYSQGLANGAVQCAGDGQLIVMLADRQTIGGYPVLGVLAPFSRAMLAQCQARQKLRFVALDHRDLSANMHIYMHHLKTLSKAQS